MSNHEVFEFVYILQDLRGNVVGTWDSYIKLEDFVEAQNLSTAEHKVIRTINNQPMTGSFLSLR